MKNQNALTILERLTAPTPKLFQTIRNGGIIIGAISAALISIESQGVDVPNWLNLIFGQLSGIAGAVAALIAQLTVDFQAKQDKEALDNLK